MSELKEYLCVEALVPEKKEIPGYLMHMAKYRAPQAEMELVYLKSAADKVIEHNKYKRCLAMEKWCEATSLWCYQAANTLPAGIHATLNGKPVMIEPARLFKRSALLTKWSERWVKIAEKFNDKEAK